MSLTAIIQAVPRLLSQVTLAASRERGDLGRRLEGIRDRLIESGSAECLCCPRCVCKVMDAVSDLTYLDREFDLHVGDVIEHEDRKRGRLMKSFARDEDDSPRLDLLHPDALRAARAQADRAARGERELAVR